MKRTHSRQNDHLHNKNSKLSASVAKAEMLLLSLLYISVPKCSILNKRKRFVASKPRDNLSNHNLRPLSDNELWYEVTVTPHCHVSKTRSNT